MLGRTLASSPVVSLRVCRNRLSWGSRNRIHSGRLGWTLRGSMFCRTNPTSLNVSSNSEEICPFDLTRQRDCRFTIDKITTHGKFKALTILTAREVFPEPLEPAIPIIYGYWLAIGCPSAPPVVCGTELTDMSVRPRWTVVNHHSVDLRGLSGVSRVRAPTEVLHKVRVTRLGFLGFVTSISTFFLVSCSTSTIKTLPFFFHHTTFLPAHPVQG